MKQPKLQLDGEPVAAGQEWLCHLQREDRGKAVKAGEGDSDSYEAMPRFIGRLPNYCVATLRRHCIDSKTPAAPNANRTATHDSNRR